jgi:hypothetical protein
VNTRVLVKWCKRQLKKMSLWDLAAHLGTDPANLDKVIKRKRMVGVA